MASYRLRAAIPAAKLGANVNHGEATIVVFSKPFLPDDLAEAKAAKSQGAKIIVDICDTHDYTEMVKVADHLVVPSTTAAQIVAAQYKAFKRPVAVIPDTYEFPHKPPHAALAEDILWFGHDSNFPDVRPYLGLRGLTVMIGPRPHEGLSCRYVPWSVENQLRELARANIVILPTRPGSEYKSANRLIAALRMGCFPVCDPHPSYTPFRECVWTSGITPGIQYARMNRLDLNDLVSDGQRIVQQSFSPKAISEKWATLFDSI